MAMRIISGEPPRTNMGNFYIDMNILTVKNIYNYNIGLFMYKYVNNKTPDVFNNFFSNISEIHQHDTRNATQKQIYVTFHGTTRGHKPWNLQMTLETKRSAIQITQNETQTTIDY